MSVAASDPDGDVLHYQWRVTAGTIENRDSNQTVWTMPDGPGLHFAYVLVSDGKGGYAQLQYAVSSDALGTEVAPRAAVTNPSPTTAADFTDTTGSLGARLRFNVGAALQFAVPASTLSAQRIVYMPDVVVLVQEMNAAKSVVFSGTSDVAGEVTLPRLVPGRQYMVSCASSQDAPLADCGTLSEVDHAVATIKSVPVATGSNLQLHGHIGLTDGAVCGLQDEFAGIQTAATVQLQLADGTKLTSPRRVNRYGDYALDAAVPVRGALQLLVQCESASQTLAVGHPTNANNAIVDYAAGQASIEVSSQISNSRPSIAKVVATGADGNVRGNPVELVPPGEVSDALPGAYQFLSYKGEDNRLSACMYYRSLGAVGGCDAEGNLVSPISFDDWKRQRGFAPYNGSTPETSATYINRMDLNLVRRMVAVQSDANEIAFYVCNHPGPFGTTQTEIDQVLDTALGDQKRVACVAMEWTASPNVNGGRPITKFLTFGPDGALLPSINLDSRGEKYMPGACVACHGGFRYSGHFATSGNPSPDLGSGFLPFDTGNYLFSTNSALTEAAQTEALYTLNQIVKATEVDRAANSETVTLINQWFASSHVLNKSYVPAQWTQLGNSAAQKADLAQLYLGVVGTSCRTCHTTMPSPAYNWDANPAGILQPTVGSVAYTHVCGGTADVALNASMPNALISRDRVADRLASQPALAALMQTYFGCSTPLPDPGYAKR